LVSTKEETYDQIVNAGFVVTKLFSCRSTNHSPNCALLFLASYIMILLKGKTIFFIPFIYLKVSFLSSILKG